MPELSNPETGDVVWASPALAEQMIKDGWQPLPTGYADVASPVDVDGDSDDKQPAADANGGQDAPPPAPDGSKPLDKMKLTELIEHAEKIGVPAEQLEPLRKPGASKAQAIELINSHTAS